MKSFFYVIAFFIGVILTATKSEGQVRINVNLNKQPEWGPVGYERVDYYYLPDIDVYYSVNEREFIYLDNNHRWVHRSELPPRYRNYDLYDNYKVVVNDNQPWSRNEDYHRRFSRYRGRHDQVLLRDRRDSRYQGNVSSDRNHSRGDVERRRRAQRYKEQQYRDAGRAGDHNDQWGRRERH